MKAVLISLFLLLAATGCATRTIQQNPYELPVCGRFDTDKLKADLAVSFRTDREWYETIIKRLIWQLDCERLHRLNPAV